MNTYRRSLGVATTVLVGGILASLAGNMKAISLESLNASAGAYVSAILWPLFLFGAIELLIHTPWLSVRRDAWTKGATLILVGFVSLWESYWHLVHVLDAYGYDQVGQHLGPLAVDAAMALATLALNRVGQARQVTSVPTPAPEPAQIPVEAPEPTPLADEASDWLETLTGRLGTLEDSVPAFVPPTETVPPVTPPSPPNEEVKLENVPETAKLLFKVWANTDPTVRPRAGQMYELVAGDHGVSPRTARRWWDATKNNL